MLYITKSVTNTYRIESVKLQRFFDKKKLVSLHAKCCSGDSTS